EGIMRLLLLRAMGLLLAPAVLTFTSPDELQAQVTGTISGRVIEAGSQRPVTSVQVVVDGSTLGAITNAAGDYSIANVPAGEHTILARRIGYRAEERSVTVTGGSVTRADFTIAQSASQLSQVVVTGTAGAVERRTVGNSITQIDVAELTENNSIMTVSEILQAKSPGVT